MTIWSSASETSLLSAEGGGSVAAGVLRIQLLLARRPRSGVALRPRFQMIPINFIEYSDGLHVRGAAKEYEPLAGARVTSIGGAPIEKAVERVRSIASGDNEMSRKADIALILTMPGVLRVDRFRDLLAADPPGGVLRAHGPVRPMVFRSARRDRLPGSTGRCWWPARRDRTRRRADGRPDAGDGRDRGHPADLGGQQRR